MKPDLYISADIETDGPIPGEYSMLSFALVLAGTFDGKDFCRFSGDDRVFYREIKPISKNFQQEALLVNGLDRETLFSKGASPEQAMNEAYEWILQKSTNLEPILVAYPLSFDWSFLYWYFTKFSVKGSPFGHSKCLDIKTMWSIKSRTPISQSGRQAIPKGFQSHTKNTHHAISDAIAQADVFSNIFEWGGNESN